MLSRGFVNRVLHSKKGFGICVMRFVVNVP